MQTIENKEIGDGKPVFIVFEAGATHTGIESAKQLAKHAKDAGADAIKFQMVDPDRLVPDPRQMFEYGIPVVKNRFAFTKTVKEPLYKILKRRVLTKEEWIDLKVYCDFIGIIFFATANFEDEVDFLVNILLVDTIKICSGDITLLPFIRYCAETDRLIQIDTGSATLGEVDLAHRTIKSTGNERVIIHNCPSGYPAKLESINLNFIQSLKDGFKCPVAFSDHSPGRDMDIAAVAVGANMIEKTITLDKTTQGPEHMFSLEPSEMKDFVQSIRNIEIAMGKFAKSISKEEEKKAHQYRRSPFLNQAVKKGQVIKLDMIRFSRNGKDVDPDTIMMTQGKKFAKDFPKGHNLYYGDWK